jgi:hypothetical protein
MKRGREYGSKTQKTIKKPLLILLAAVFSLSAALFLTSCEYATFPSVDKALALNFQLSESAESGTLLHDGRIFKVIDDGFTVTATDTDGAPKIIGRFEISAFETLIFEMYRDYIVLAGQSAEDGSFRIMLFLLSRLTTEELQKADGTAVPVRELGIAGTLQKSELAGNYRYFVVSPPNGGRKEYTDSLFGLKRIFSVISNRRNPDAKNAVVLKLNLSDHTLPLTATIITDSLTDIYFFEGAIFAVTERRGQKQQDIMRERRIIREGRVVETRQVETKRTVESIDFEIIKLSTDFKILARTVDTKEQIAKSEVLLAHYYDGSFFAVIDRRTEYGSESNSIPLVQNFVELVSYDEKLNQQSSLRLVEFHLAFARGFGGGRFVMNLNTGIDASLIHRIHFVRLNNPKSLVLETSAPPPPPALRRFHYGSVYVLVENEQLSIHRSSNNTRLSVLPISLGATVLHDPETGLIAVTNVVQDGERGVLAVRVDGEQFVCRFLSYFENRHYPNIPKDYLNRVFNVRHVAFSENSILLISGALVSGFDNTNFQSLGTVDVRNYSPPDNFKLRFYADSEHIGQDNIDLEDMYVRITPHRDLMKSPAVIPEREGYIFGGWRDYTGVELKAGRPVYFAGDFYAMWIENKVIN